MKKLLVFLAVMIVCCMAVQSADAGVYYRGGHRYGGYRYYGGPYRGYGYYPGRNVYVHAGYYPWYNGYWRGGYYGGVYYR